MNASQSILDSADKRDIAADARDVAAEQRESDLDQAKFLGSEGDDGFGGDWSQRRGAGLDRKDA